MRTNPGNAENSGQEPKNERETDEAEILEARVGFEPTNGGFADLSLRPLGYRAPDLHCPALWPLKQTAWSNRSIADSARGAKRLNLLRRYPKLPADFHHSLSYNCAAAEV